VEAGAVSIAARRAAKNRTGLLQNTPSPGPQSRASGCCFGWFDQFVGVEAQERVDDVGVELLAAVAADFLECALERPGLLVGAVVGECVEDVGERDDAAADRDRAVS
jgi:hypothetical protein